VYLLFHNNKLSHTTLCKHHSLCTGHLLGLGCRTNCLRFCLVGRICFLCGSPWRRRGAIHSKFCSYLKTKTSINCLLDGSHPTVWHYKHIYFYVIHNNNKTHNIMCYNLMVCIIMCLHNNWTNILPSYLVFKCDLNQGCNIFHLPEYVF